MFTVDLNRSVTRDWENNKVVNVISSITSRSPQLEIYPYTAFYPDNELIEGGEIYNDVLEQLNTGIFTYTVNHYEEEEHRWKALYLDFYENMFNKELYTSNIIVLYFEPLNLEFMDNYFSKFLELEDIE